MAKPTDNFMDEVHRWTFDDREPKCRPIAARYRMALRRAQRFVLDDEAVKLVCHLSHDNKDLEARSFLARLPYEYTWIEFNLHAKVTELLSMGKLQKLHGGNPDFSEISRVMGLLFYPDGPETRTRWICHQYMRGYDNKVYADPLAFVFDPEGSLLHPLRGSVMWKSPTLSLRPGFPKMPFRIQMSTDGKTDDPVAVQGHSTKKLAHFPAKRVAHDVVELEQKVDPEIFLLGLYEITDDGIRCPDWLISRAAVIVEPWMEAFHSTTGRKKRVGMDYVNQLALAEANELSRHFLWIITLLAAINGLPKDVKPMVSAGRQTVGMHVLPYFQHSTLTINLPREDRIRRARVILNRQGRNARRPWHEVIGHWRIIERGKPLPGYYCRHIPTMVEHGLGVCEKCEMLIRWIPQHERGDPTIGIVRHTYSVHGKRQTARVELDNKGEH